MRRILTVMTGALVMAAMMVAMAMPAFAWHNHVLSTGECGNKGQCTGFGDSDNKGSAQNNDPGKGQSNVTGDDRNGVCEDNGVCIGAINN